MSCTNPMRKTEANKSVPSITKVWADLQQRWALDLDWTGSGLQHILLNLD